MVYAPDYTSKNHPQGIPLDVNQQILLFEKRVHTWILDYAKMLLNENNAGFAILIILNAIPEMLAQFRGHVGSVEELYREGLLYIFPEIQGEHEDFIINELYSHKRNAIAHMGFTSSNIILNGQHPNLTLCNLNENTFIILNPVEWYNQVNKMFEQYIIELKDNSNKELRDKFAERMKRPN